MKKIYICPQTEITVAQMEQFILAASDPIDGMGVFDADADDSDVLSRTWGM